MAEIVRIHPERRSSLPEPLWREVLGRRLRTLRERLGQTLTETAHRAGISPQYLSEIERGRKEPSSEMIAAVAGALGSTLVDLTGQVSDELRRREAAEVARIRMPSAPAQLLSTVADATVADVRVADVRVADVTSAEVVLVLAA